MRDSLAKVFAVLDVVASSDGAVTLKDMARITGYHPSTISRILSNLVEIGCVRKESYRSFSLDLGMIPLGQQALTHFPLPKVANPMIEETARRLGVQGALTGLHHGRVVYLYRTRLQWEPGILADDFRYPLHRSNCGLVMLAGGDDGEARGWLEKSLAGGEGTPAVLDELLERVRGVRRDGYSKLIENPGWNVAFPLSFRGRAFSVALHDGGAPPDNMDKIVLECSLLARRVDAAARELG